MILNAQRVRMRQSYTVLMALLDAKNQRVSPEYFAAMYDENEEAEAMYAIYEQRANDAEASQPTRG